ncbi:MAG: histidine phosphatase family protein [Acidimicrobiales bacterium]
MPPGTEHRQVRFRRPPGATDILLIRHGESEAARPDVPFPLVDGLGDPELHPEGRAQAEAVAQRLADEDIAAIYVTNLRRTAQTAAPLAGLLGLTPIVEPDLREVHLGDWEGGVYRSRVAAGDPLLAEVLRQQRWDVIPGAERAEAFEARVRAALDRVAAAHPDRLVAVFTHGGVIGEALAQTASSARLAFSAADNASISQVTLGPGLGTVRRFNDTSHLAQTLAPVAAPPL